MVSINYIQVIVKNAGWANKSNTFSTLTLALTLIKTLATTQTGILADETWYNTLQPCQKILANTTIGHVIWLRIQKYNFNMLPIFLMSLYVTLFRMCQE